MKKTKIIIPAMGMLLLGTAASVTGTVAWFSANTSVSMTGMKVQAKAESGLVISADKTDASWADTDETLYTTAVSLAPTSTANLANWYHASSNSAASYAGISTTYKTLTDSADSDTNIQVVTTNLASGSGTPVANITYDNDATAGYIAADDTGYYLQTRFYLKSSGDAITVNGTAQWLEIQKITLSGVSASANLDASLRIGVKVDSAVKILAPFAASSGRSADGEAHTITYAVNKVDSACTAYQGVLAADGNYLANLDSGFTGTIPAKTTDTPINVDIYLWFEGEDGNCMSNNLMATLDTLTVGVSVGLVNSAPSGVSSAS